MDQQVNPHTPLDGYTNLFWCVYGSVYPHCIALYQAIIGEF